MSSSSISSKKDEFEMSIFIEFLFRNRKNLSIITLISIFLSTIYALTQRHIWEGQFQIVISQRTTLPTLKSADIQFDLDSLINASNIDLKTDVEILKSPYVLAPVYNYVQADKKEKKRKKEILVYSKWLKNNLSINLERGTSILNLSYRDKDKNLIIPVLNQISKEYQSYSGKKKRKDINSGIDFTSKQIKKYEKQSAESYAKAQKFAIENKFDLPSLRRQEKTSYFSIEEKISKAQQVIQTSETQIKKLQLMEDYSNLVLYSLSTEKFKNNYLLEEISKFDNLIGKAKLIYLEDDEYINNLKEQKTFLLKELKKEYILFLEAEKLNAEAQLKSLIKPQDVLIKYRKILGKAIKDEKTLEQLNSQFRFLSLEKAKNNDPWELITTPTLLPEPVAPSKKRIVVFGGLLGLLIGLTSIKYIEHKKGLIYSPRELEKFIDIPLISVLNKKDSENIEQSLDVFISGLLSQKIEKIGILNLGSSNQEFFKKINKYLNDNYSGKFLFSKNLADFKNFNNIVLSIDIGSTLKKSYYDLMKNNKFQNKNIIGCLAILIQYEKVNS